MGQSLGIKATLLLVPAAPSRTSLGAVSSPRRASQRIVICGERARHSRKVEFFSTPKTTFSTAAVPVQGRGECPERGCVTGGRAGSREQPARGGSAAFPARCRPPSWAWRSLVWLPPPELALTLCRVLALAERVSFQHVLAAGTPVGEQRGCGIAPRQCLKKGD